MLASLQLAVREIEVALVKPTTVGREGIKIRCSANRQSHGIAEELLRPIEPALHDDLASRYLRFGVMVVALRQWSQRIANDLLDLFDQGIHLLFVKHIQAVPKFMEMERLIQ